MDFASIAAPAVPLVVAVAALAVVAVRVHRGGTGIAGPVAVAGATSVGWTIGTAVLGWPPLPPWGFLEPVASCALLAALARYAPAGWRSAGTGLLVAAAATTAILRADAEFAVGYGLGVWSTAPVAAGLLGLLGRRRRERRDAEVESQHRQQRLELARDLHDHVAHDVSDMLASVQAARFLTGTGDDTGTGPSGMLARAEAAGQRAMASLDQVVAVLHDPSGEPSRRPAPDLRELPALVERFNSAGGGRAELLIDVDPHAVPREPSALAYRLVVESLTNVRRHASRGTRVDVSVTALDGPGIRVSVRDTGPARRTGTTRSGGTGITALRARVEALGGALSAGPAGSGWALESSLPFAPGADG